MRKILLTSAALILSANQAFAASNHDHSSPHHHRKEGFYGHLHALVHADGIFKADDEKEGRINELYSHAHMGIGYGFNDKFSINSNLKLEGGPSGHSHGATISNEAEGQDKYFENHQLIAEEITVNYDDKYFSLYAGKFNPKVGFGMHNFGGIYNYQTVEDYSLLEKVGVGGALKYDAGDFGKHQLEASTFFADTTFLSDSLLKQRKNNSKEDGGLANSENFSSFAVSLSGSDFFSLNNNLVEGLEYRFGYAKQHAGIDNEENETRYSIGAGYKQQLTQDLKAKLLFDYLKIDHLGGEEYHDRSYSNFALNFDYKKWNLNSSYIFIRNNAEDDHEGQDGEIAEFSVGYNFNNGLGLALGYQTKDEEGEKSKRIGLVLKYDFDI